MSMKTAYEAALCRSEASHPIPPMTHPYGKYWTQPSRFDIEIDDTHAMMSQSSFEALHEYSSSLPTGAYEGKMWKGHHKDGWFLHWFDASPDDPNSVRRYNRKIIIA